jgi:hypothetical protein
MNTIVYYNGEIKTRKKHKFYYDENGEYYLFEKKLICIKISKRKPVINDIIWKYPKKQQEYIIRNICKFLEIDRTTFYIKLLTREIKTLSIDL